MAQNLIDDADCGNFFDQIDDLIKFPADGECGGYESKDIPSLWSDPLPDAGNIFPGSHTDDLLGELYVPVPCEDIVQLEWLSAFVEDSFSSEGMTMGKENCTKKEHFQTSSPVSVLESSSSSSSSSSAGKTSPPLSPSHHGTQRARSKRPRPQTFNPRSGIHLIDTPRAFYAEPENFTPKKTVKPIATEPQKKKIKITSSSTPKEAVDTPPPLPHTVRKCLHCEITKTPQWRAGPMGPKTLCNACGVRYKSGRLFPEYRPAASPTFVASLHSNSHKKVVEMRTKAVDATTTTEPTSPTSPNAA